MAAQARAADAAYAAAMARGDTAAAQAAVHSRDVAVAIYRGETPPPPPPTPQPEPRVARPPAAQPKPPITKKYAYEVEGRINNLLAEAERLSLQGNQAAAALKVEQAKYQFSQNLAGRTGQGTGGAVTGSINRMQDLLFRPPPAPAAPTPKPPPPPVFTGGGGGGGGGGFSYTPAAPSPPKPKIVKNPNRDVVDLSREEFSASSIARLLYDDVGSIELVNIARRETIEGQNPYYTLISNLSAIRKNFDPTSIIARQKSNKNIENNYIISLNDKIPDDQYLERNNLEDFYYIAENGDLIIELDNLASDEIIDFEIATSGTINLVDEV